MTNTTYFHSAIRDDESTSVDDESLELSERFDTNLNLSPELKSFSWGEVVDATRNFDPDTLAGKGGFGWVDELERIQGGYDGSRGQNKYTSQEKAHKFKSSIQLGFVGKSKYTGNGKKLTSNNKSSSKTNKLKTIRASKSTTQYQDSTKNPVYGILKKHASVGEKTYAIDSTQVCDKHVRFSSKDWILVYEFIPEESLDNHLFGEDSSTEPLSWSVRLNIALETAKTLAFLHRSKVIHGDFRTSNILVDSNYMPKIIDFGIVKAPKFQIPLEGIYGDFDFKNVHCAPEDLSQGAVSYKGDVYSYGVFLLEILCGRRAVDFDPQYIEHNLLHWAKPHLNYIHTLHHVVDKRLKSQYSADGAFQVARLALRCLSMAADKRPNMEMVVAILKKLIQEHSEIRKKRRYPTGNTYVKWRT